MKIKYIMKVPYLLIYRRAIVWESIHILQCNCTLKIFFDLWIWHSLKSIAATFSENVIEWWNNAFQVKGLRGVYQNSSQNSAHKVCKHSRCAVVFSKVQTHLSLNLYEVLFHYLMNLVLWMLVQCPVHLSKSIIFWVEMHFKPSSKTFSIYSELKTRRG